MRFLTNFPSFLHPDFTVRYSFTLPFQPSNLLPDHSSYKWLNELSSVNRTKTLFKDTIILFGGNPKGHSDDAKGGEY